MLKATLLIIFLYFLVIIQATFLPHFNFWDFVPNFVLIAVIIINLFEKSRGGTGIASAILGGFFLDIFSARPFGFWIIILLSAAILIKYLFKKYLQPPSFRFAKTQVKMRVTPKG